MLRRVATLALVLGACTTDFFLEAGTDAATEGASSGESPTSGAPTSTSLTGSSAEGSTGSTGEPGTTDSPTTSGAETEAGSETTETSSTRGTTEGSETTGDPTTGDPTSAEEATAEEASAEAGAETGGTAGVLDCPEIEGGQEGCEATPACDWYGDGPCFADACHPDIATVCDGFVFEVCGEMPLCMWFGVPKEGECGLVPCGELDNAEACLAAPRCTWIAEEPGACVEIECPGCWELGELDCMETKACAWLDVQESCVPD